MAGILITPGKTFGPNEKITTAKLNALGTPIANLEEDSVGEFELIEAAVQAIAGDPTQFMGKTRIIDRDGTMPGIYQSSDFVPATLTDGAIETGSATLSTPGGILTDADVGRAIIGTGIPAGTIISGRVGATIALLSEALLIQYTDGVITGGTTLTSATAVFSPLDNGNTILGTGIPAGTTGTYVSATQVTLSQAATNGTGVVFSVNSRLQSSYHFTIVGRGKGWRFQVDADGLGLMEIYAGTFSAKLQVGKFIQNADGGFTLGAGPSAGVPKLTAAANGDFTWGTAAAVIGITHDGKLFAGAATYADAIMKIASSGDVVIAAPGFSAHNIATDAINPVVSPVIASPYGGAIINPTNVSLNCLTKYSRIYYRSVAPDGVTNSTTAFTSASGNFSPNDIGKTITGNGGIQADTVIAAWTSTTAITLSKPTTATATNVDYNVYPTTTDSLYVDGTPLVLTASRHILARAYKNGEYSPLTIYVFTVDAATVSNPYFSPVTGNYATSDGKLTVTIMSPTLGASIRYTTDGTTPTSAVGTLISPASGATAPTGTCSIWGSKTVKAIAFKATLADSDVLSAAYVITTGGSGGAGGGGSGGAGGGGGGHSLP